MYLRCCRCAGDDPDAHVPGGLADQLHRVGVGIPGAGCLGDRGAGLADDDAPGRQVIVSHGQRRRVVFGGDCAQAGQLPDCHRHDLRRQVAVAVGRGREGDRCRLHVILVVVMSGERERRRGRVRVGERHVCARGRDGEEGVHGAGECCPRRRGQLQGHVQGLSHVFFQ